MNQADEPCNLLYGWPQIAAWMQLTIETVRQMAKDGLLPVFKLPGRSKPCALKSSINAALRGYEQQWREKTDGPAES